MEKTFSRLEVLVSLVVSTFASGDCREHRRGSQPNASASTLEASRECSCHCFFFDATPLSKDKGAQNFFVFRPNLRTCQKDKKQCPLNQNPGYVTASTGKCCAPFKDSNSFRVLKLHGKSCSPKISQKIFSKFCSVWSQKQ